MKHLVFTLTNILLIFSFCQGGLSQIPANTGFHPVNIPGLQPAITPHYDNHSVVPNHGSRGYGSVGATADDIMRQANRTNPYYRVGNDPASIQRANQAWIQERMTNDPAYNPALRNSIGNIGYLNQQQQLFKELQEIIYQDNDRAVVQQQAKSQGTITESASLTKPYLVALQQLKDMLSGKRKLSIADAYYVMENAYGETYLSYSEFKDIIRRSADFIRQWMCQNLLDGKDNAAINYAVQQFMGNQLSIALPAPASEGTARLKTVTHIPFFYDYNDYQGEKDHRNYFLTKCLATGTGQCNSLPAVYLILIEALGGTAHLAVAPQHALIKYPDKGQMRNYEPTSNWDISDQWYQEHMFIGATAIQKKVYLHPFSNKQLLAEIILQLSFGYFRKFGGMDGKFITECIHAAEEQFPMNNNLTILFTISNLYQYQLLQVMRKNNFTTLDDIDKSPEAKTIYMQWLANEDRISALGYRQYPISMYEEMMKEHEFKGRVQQQQNINTKERRSLFIN